MVATWKSRSPLACPLDWHAYYSSNKKWWAQYQRPTCLESRLNSDKLFTSEIRKKIDRPLIWYNKYSKHIQMN